MIIYNSLARTITPLNEHCLRPIPRVARVHIPGPLAPAVDKFMLTCCLCYLFCVRYNKSTCNWPCWTMATALYYSYISYCSCLIASVIVNFMTMSMLHYTTPSPAPLPASRLINDQPNRLCCVHGTGRETPFKYLNNDKRWFTGRSVDAIIKRMKRVALSALVAF